VYSQPDKATFRKRGVNIHNLQELALGTPNAAEQFSLKQRDGIRILAKIKVTV
jgi:hypothetical protein